MKRLKASKIGCRMLDVTLVRLFATYVHVSEAVLDNSLGSKEEERLRVSGRCQSFCWEVLKALDQLQALGSSALRRPIPSQSRPT